MEHREPETAEYILRYYLPMEPYADAALTHLRFDQLLDFCRETGTRAVMFYVAFRTDWYYMPDTARTRRALGGRDGARLSAVCGKRASPIS